MTACTGRPCRQSLAAASTPDTRKPAAARAASVESPVGSVLAVNQDGRADLPPLASPAVGSAGGCVAQPKVLVARSKRSLARVRGSPAARSARARASRVVCQRVSGTAGPRISTHACPSGSGVSVTSRSAVAAAVRTAAASASSASAARRTA